MGNVTFCYPVAAAITEDNSQVANESVPVNTDAIMSALAVEASALGALHAVVAQGESAAWLFALLPPRSGASLEFSGFCRLDGSRERDSR